jgi:hypothetical protein
MKNTKTKTDLIIEIVNIQSANSSLVKKSLEITAYERCGYTKKELILKLEGLKK